MQSGARLSSGLLIIVAVTSLVVGFLGGSGFGRQDLFKITNLSGRIGAVSEDGSSVCVATASSNECKPPRLEPDAEVPAVGTAVEAYSAPIPNENGDCCVDSWLALASAPPTPVPS